MIRSIKALRRVGDFRRAVNNSSRNFRSALDNARKKTFSNSNQWSQNFTSRVNSPLKNSNTQSPKGKTKPPFLKRLKGWLAAATATFAITGSSAAHARENFVKGELFAQARNPKVALTSNVEAQLASATSKKYQVVTESTGLNVRSEPNISNPSNIISSLPKGAEVTVYEIKDDWARISPDGESPQWVSLKFLQQIQVDASSPATSKKYQVVTESTGLNVRSEPNISNPSNIISSLPKGAEVTVYEIRGDWARISPGDKSPQWVSLGFLAEIENKPKVQKPQKPGEVKPSDVKETFDPVPFKELKTALDRLKVEQNTVYIGGNVLKLEGGQMAITASHVVAENRAREPIIQSTYKIHKPITATLSYRPVGSSSTQTHSVKIPANAKKDDIERIVDGFLKSQDPTFQTVKGQGYAHDNRVQADGTVVLPYSDSGYYSAPNNGDRTIYREMAHENGSGDSQYEIEVKVSRADLQPKEHKFIGGLPQAKLGDLENIGTIGGKALPLGQDLILLGNPDIDPNALQAEASKIRSAYDELHHLSINDPYKPLPTLMYTKGDEKDFEASNQGNSRYVAGYTVTAKTNSGVKLFVPIPEEVDTADFGFEIADTKDDYKPDRGNSGSPCQIMLPSGRTAFCALSGGGIGNPLPLPYPRGLTEQDLSQIKAKLIELGYSEKDLKNKKNFFEIMIFLAVPGTDAELN